MCSLHFVLPLLTGQVVICCLLIGRGDCNAPTRKDVCQVQHGRADCSRLSLKEIPSDLPRNITSLDISHNRFVRLSPLSLAAYPGLLKLDVGFNSISRLEVGLCQTLVLLQELNVQHNELHLVTENDLSYCGNLTRLNVSSNRLKLQGEPFSALQNLISLDVSNNQLVSARLGSKAQLPNLETLVLSENHISTFKKEDLSFLCNSSFLRVLKLSSLPLKTLEPGFLWPVRRIRTLIMDGCKISPKTVSILCAELFGSAVRNLFLQNINLVTLANETLGALSMTNVTRLDLSNNHLTKIQEGSFQNLSKLEVLLLEEHTLKHLTKNTFNGLSSLKNLNMRRTSVKGHTSTSLIIDDFTFQPLSELETLILDHTPIREIKKYTFTGLISLSYLSMAWSSCAALKGITNQTFVSLAASPLRVLDLTGTSISKIDPGSFSSLGNLTNLQLSHNFIRQNLTGEEFEGLNKVVEINLSYNTQTISLKSKSFSYVPTLRKLMLSKALTGTLDLNPSPFKPLSNLTFLDLSNNNIANINMGLLDGLNNLKVLKLQHNNLARLWKSANPGGPVLFLNGLHSLTALEMDYTGLDEIPVEAFRGLFNLRDLSLSNNLLNHLKDAIFDDLHSLEFLSMQKNLITAVRPEVFKPIFGNLSRLIITKNPFDCTCESILWFVMWLNQTNTSFPGVKSDYMCNTPLAYFNHSIFNFNTLFCKDMAPFQLFYIVSSTAVILLIVTAFLIEFHGWQIQFYWNIVVSRALGLNDAISEEERRFEYDAYVIYAERDSNWVERSLIPLEHDNYAFCLEDRDSVPGVSRLDSIIGNMNRSRKILFVITESLLKDPWCGRFKAHHALHQVIEASRDSVVLVFLQDVQDYRLSRTLFLRRGMLRSRCVLHWPTHKSRVPAFHQKLRIALGTTNELQL